MTTIAEEAPDGPEARELLRQSDEFAASLYPPENRYPIDASELSAKGAHFFVARRDGVAVGCMALVPSGPGKAELKRCFVNGAVRGQGVGGALLLTAEKAARNSGIRTIQLETGNRNHAALRLYRGSGYRDRGPFGDYPDNGVSVFLEKAL
jgi:putative acetyltransferase